MDWTKIMDFLLIANFCMCAIFSYSDFTIFNRHVKVSEIITNISFSTVFGMPTRYITSFDKPQFPEEKEEEVENLF